MTKLPKVIDLDDEFWARARKGMKPDALPTSLSFAIFRARLTYTEGSVTITETLAGEHPSHEFAIAAAEREIAEREEVRNPPRQAVTESDRAHAQKALQHVRNAMIANKHGAPPGPSLEAAEEALLRLLFSEEEIAEYLQSPGAQVYR